jgi:hypothetical protein
MTYSSGRFVPTFKFRDLRNELAHFSAQNGYHG